LNESVRIIGIVYCLYVPHECLVCNTLTFLSFLPVSLSICVWLQWRPHRGLSGPVQQQLWWT